MNVAEEKRKEEEKTPLSEVIDASERIVVSAEEKTLILDHDQHRNYGFVGEIITVSEETLSELKRILRRSEHSSIDLLLDCFHRASGIRSHILFTCLLLSTTYTFVQNSKCEVARVFQLLL